MTLKEKFENNITETQGNIKISDEFAIGFASWFILYYREEAFYNESYIEEMLEIYKKEKGL